MKSTIQKSWYKLSLTLSGMQKDLFNDYDKQILCDGDINLFWKLSDLHTPWIHRLMTIHAFSLIKKES